MVSSYSYLNNQCVVCFLRRLLLTSIPKKRPQRLSVAFGMNCKLCCTCDVLHECCCYSLCLIYRTLSLVSYFGQIYYLPSTICADSFTAPQVYTCCSFCLENLLPTSVLLFWCITSMYVLYYKYVSSYLPQHWHTMGTVVDGLIYSMTYLSNLRCVPSKCLILWWTLGMIVYQLAFAT